MILILHLQTIGCASTGATVGLAFTRRNVSFAYTSDIRDYEGSAYHITCEYDHSSKDLVVQLNQDGSEALKLLRYQWATEQPIPQSGAEGPAGSLVSVDESYHFKSNGSKRVTLSGVPPHTRVSIGLVPNPDHEQGSKYWIYIGSTCWTGSKIGKPSKVHILPTSAFTHPLVEWSAPRGPSGPIDGYDFRWCIMPVEDKIERATRQVTPSQRNNSSTIVAISFEQRGVATEQTRRPLPGQNGQAHLKRSHQSGTFSQNGQSFKTAQGQGASTANNDHNIQGSIGNTYSRRTIFEVNSRGYDQRVQVPSRGVQGKGLKALKETDPSSTTTTGISTTPPLLSKISTTTTTKAPKPEPKCATKDIPVNPANVDVFKGYKTIIEGYDPSAIYRVCIRAYNWKGTDKVHSDEQCQTRRERAYFERDYFKMCPQ
ncbi:hypothetical protein BIW11_06611 [Tropilaelaps mercedesae]|uniref:Uncharacterized protein n=1 Tax=Tropilaelaps mercedesae TaxID=418985 RepID=A0A1V9XXI7_9ACAR|nr:hypothetical protein BIW11_06611 [Tropilaelaps mercedesae]